MYVWNLLESKFEERGVILKSFQERRFRQHALLRAWCGFSAARGTSWGLRRRLYNHSAAMLPLVEAGFRVPWAIWISIANVTIQQDARRILFSKYVCIYIYIHCMYIYIYIYIYIYNTYIYACVHLEWLLESGRRSKKLLLLVFWNDLVPISKIKTVWSCRSLGSAGDHAAVCFFAAGPVLLRKEARRGARCPNP